MQVLCKSQVNILQFKKQLKKQVSQEVGQEVNL